MDDSLNQLENCQHLGLSTNDIEKIYPLPKLKQLKILSLARNRIRKINNLDEVSNTLEELWLSYNLIDRLDGLQPCQNLRVLYIACNRIKTLEEVQRLSNLSNLAKLVLMGNPLYGDKPREEMAPYVFKRVQQLTELDTKAITGAVRRAAESLD